MQQVLSHTIITDSAFLVKAYFDGMIIFKRITMVYKIYVANIASSW